MGFIDAFECRKFRIFFVRKLSKYMSILLRILGASVGKNVKFYGKVIFKGRYENIKIGDNCTFNEGVYIAAREKITIDNNVRISAFSKIITGNLDLTTMKHIFSEVKIKDNVWIGTGSTILPGILIEEGSVVAAGSVVTKDISEKSIVAGIPAKVIRKIEQ